MQKFQQISLCFDLGLKKISIGKNGKLILDILMLLFSHPIKMNNEIQNLLNGTNHFAEGMLKSRKKSENLVFTKSCHFHFVALKKEKYELVLINLKLKVLLNVQDVN